MAWVGLLDAFVMDDVVADIAATDWGAARGAFDIARAPTFSEAVKGAVGIGGLVGAEPALKGIVKSAMGGRSKTRSGNTFKPGPGESHLRPNLVQLNTPLSKIHRSINTGSHGMSSKSAPHDGEDVPVIPPPRKISKIHPDYFTIELPFALIHQVESTATFPHANIKPVATVRLNSIYDPIANVRSGTGGTDPQITSNAQPQGRNVWAPHFKYYRVLRSDVKVTIINASLIGSGAFPLFHSFVCGYEIADEDAVLSNNATAFLTTKHAKRAILPPATRAGASNMKANSAQVFTFTYFPENWDYHVEGTGAEERWTPIAENPNIDHHLNVRLFHMDATNAPTGNISMIVQVSYKVQFREAIDSFFKTQNTEVAASDI